MVNRDHPAQPELWSGPPKGSLFEAIQYVLYLPGCVGIERSREDWGARSISFQELTPRSGRQATCYLGAG